jgi:hypothetical protein
MPCSDITEILEVILDENDCLKEYAFAKRTCGQGVGAQALILEHIQSRPLNELLFMTADQFLAEFPIADPDEEFLSLKHLFAIQGALEVYTGAEAGGRHDFFAASGIEYDVDETRIAGQIAVDVVVEKIEACGNCTSCNAAPDDKQAMAQKVVRSSLRKALK